MDERVDAVVVILLNDFDPWPGLMVEWRAGLRVRAGETSLS
jgi:hypothetical protein